jgi:spore germination cell wall hydrolase CwlJ-like protein
MLKKILASIIVGITIIGFGYTMASMKYDMPLKVYYTQLNPFAQKEIRCLADNIYFEAGYEPEKGQKAVAFVTLNRVKSGVFPETICGVVKQKTTSVCQFSWYCEERPKRLSYSGDLTPRQELVYNDIRNLAIHVYANYDKIQDPTKGALFYHADYVNPRWKNMIHTATIGRHIFYIRKDLM